MNEDDKLQAELTLTDELLRAEAAHLLEIEEKRRMIVDGLAEIAAPSEMWEQYIDEVDQQIELAGSRLEKLQQLRAEGHARLETKQ